MITSAHAWFGVGRMPAALLGFEAYSDKEGTGGITLVGLWNLPRGVVSPIRLRPDALYEVTITGGIDNDSDGKTDEQGSVMLAYNAEKIVVQRAGQLPVTLSRIAGSVVSTNPMTLPLREDIQPTQPVKVE